MSLQLVDAKVNSILPLEGKIITIDPGHGGRDSGTMSGKLMEKRFKFRDILSVKKFLKKMGEMFFMARMVFERFICCGGGWKKERGRK